MVKLTLIRHGQSIWNLENRFTGWGDIPLTKKGIREAKIAGKKLKDEHFDIVFTSELIRAQMTCFEVLNINNNNNKFFKFHKNKGENYSRYLKNHSELNYTPLFVYEELNERDYGDLEGLNKAETAKKFGDEQVHEWRRSYATAPPGGESLKDTYKRTIPFYKKVIEKELIKKKNILISAHGNSLRSIIKYIEKISDENIPSLELKTGVPIIYEFDDNLKIKSKKVLE